MQISYIQYTAPVILLLIVIISLHHLITDSLQPHGQNINSSPNHRIPSTTNDRLYTPYYRQAIRPCKYYTKQISIEPNLCEASQPLSQTNNHKIHFNHHGNDGIASSIDDDNLCMDNYNFYTVIDFICGTIGTVLIGSILSQIAQSASSKSFLKLTSLISLIDAMHSQNCMFIFLRIHEYFIQI